MTTNTDKQRNSADWDPTQYLKFSDHRLRPGLELLDRIPLQAPSRIFDLGCGTGHITRLIAERWPEAEVVGLDNSAQMLDKARAEASRVVWRLGNIETWSPDEPAELIYSNAALHWVNGHRELFPRLASLLARGGVLAVQMPLSWGQPSHQLMRATLADGGPGGAPLGTAELRSKVRRKWVEEAALYYRWLAGICTHLDIWETEYLQILKGQDAVFEWVRGTGLRPILNGLQEDQLSTFLAAYKERLRTAYPYQADGRTLYPFRRIFIVAQV